MEQILDIGFTQKKKVLVAEDEPGIAGLIDDWLSEVYDVTVVVNGRACVQKAKWNTPDVVLVDIMMPDMGGYEVVRALRGEAQTASTPVIAMTANAFDDSTVRLIKAEANVVGFLNKPFKRETLLLTIEKALASRPAGA